MTDYERQQLTGHPVVLYDGLCGLCNATVRTLLRHPRAGAFRFVPQQSPLAAELLAAFPAPRQPEPEGVLLLTDALTPAARLLRRTDAIRQAQTMLGGPFHTAVACVLGWLPTTLREAAYAQVARHRYRIFGRYPSCPAPTPEQRGRILGVEPLLEGHNP
ncbi:MAG: DUF393 domain-containing protein [Acidobacteriota bacterium]|nr:DUF393 domain-containing protein [Acidobacteriota bacterium]